jgi:hypothetical protein
MSEAESTIREPKVIKRYTNRKLYDTVESRYVTLDEIAEMVKQNVEVKIVDNRTRKISPQSRWRRSSSRKRRRRTRCPCRCCARSSASLASA